MLTPEDTPTLGPVLILFNARVLGISIVDMGDLTVEFEHGVSIEVHPDDTYEAWQLSGSQGFMLICGPGGSVALFQEPG